MTEQNWVIIFTTNVLYEAEILKEFLSSNEIDTFVLNKQDSLYHIGDIELYSMPEDVMKAKLLIEKFNN